MIDTIFPIYLQLKIFQLEGYDINRFLRWIFSHFFVRKLDNKKKLIYTLKIKLILLLSVIILICIFVSLSVAKGLILAIFVSAVLMTQPYILFSLSEIIVDVPQYVVTQIIVFRTRGKIKSFKHLNVVGITGSYGKSSTKEILYQLIKDDFVTLRTPESYNTTLGISKVVDYELDKNYDVFICEMAAYHLNDIKKLCFMVPPKYGVITGITSQHLERFGSLKNIVRTKFELSNNITDKSHIVFNLNDKNIMSEIENRKIQNPIGYLDAEELKFSKGGSEFFLNFNNRKYQIKTTLFGFSNVENLLGAIRMALILGIDIKKLISRASTLEQISNRSKISEYGKAVFVDNTFSSNEQAFRETLKTAKAVHGSKVLVTPGLVELGDSEREIHIQLGQEARKIFDKVVLVGKNNRTIAFSDGLQEKVELIEDTRKEYFAKINELKNEFDWVFLENDITENY